jgi:hypothetical protein
MFLVPCSLHFPFAFVSFRHCEVRSNPVRASLSAFFFWIASLRSQ